MTFDELVDACWADLPPIRKHFVGKTRVRSLLVDSLQEMDIDQLRACQTPDDYARAREQLLGRVERRCAADDRDGFAILAFLAITIAAAIISWLVQRWLDNHFPPKRDDIEALKASFP